MTKTHRTQVRLKTEAKTAEDWKLPKKRRENNVPPVLHQWNTASILWSNPASFGTRSAGVRLAIGLLWAVGLLFCPHAKAQSYKVLHDFRYYGYGYSGEYPVGGLVLGSDGNFYGTTSEGGLKNKGLVFRMTPSGELTTLVDMDFGSGANPHGRLTEGSDGYFYGTTYHGGPDNTGMVFSARPNGTLQTVAEFGLYGGSLPYAGLVEDKDHPGIFYGTTGSGYDYGTVFKVTLGDRFVQTLVRFTGVNGSDPRAGLVQGNDGNFYGTTYAGGTANLGTVFRLAPTGELTTIASFSGYDGSHPSAELIQDSVGILYGTTAFGGRNNCGTVFTANPSAPGVEPLVHFNGDNGKTPMGALVECIDGFYGTTSQGTRGLGTVFKMTPSGALTTLVNFTGTGGTNPGNGPHGALLQGNDGNLYGTTFNGGSADYGTVFRVGRIAVINASAVPGPGGTVLGEGSFLLGGSVKLSAFANVGYIFVNWTEDGAGISSNPILSFTASADRTLEAHFARSYKIQVSASSSGGATSGGGTSEAGSTQTVTAIPKSGYSFMNWTESETVVSTSSSYTFLLSQDRQLIANFAIDIDDNVPISSLAGAAGSSRYLKISVPPGATNLRVATIGGSGKPDITLALGGFDGTGITYGSSSSKTSESILVPSPAAGDYFIRVYGYTAYTGVALVASFTAADAAARTWTVMVDKAPAEGGIVMGGGVYAAGGAPNVQAVPRSGYIFVNWTESGAVVSADPSFTLLAQDRDRTLVANFASISKNFSDVAGTYQGLLGNEDSPYGGAGGVHLQVTASGGYTAKLFVGDQKVVTKGFISAVTARGAFSTHTNVVTIDGELAIDLNGADRITGKLTANGVQTTLIADRLAYNVKHQNLAPQVGAYTVLLRPRASPTGDLRYPQAYGYARLSVSDGGVVKLAGALGDGTPVAAASGLSKDGRFSLFLSLYAARGSVSGWVSFRDLGSVSDLDAVLRWSKPQRLRDRLYASGFSGQSDLVGSRYVPPREGASILNFGTTGIADVTMSSTDRAANLREVISLNSRNGVVVAPPNSNQLKLVLSAKNGMINGSVTPAGTRELKSVRGVILQKQGLGGGQFRDETQFGALEITPTP